MNREGLGPYEHVFITDQKCVCCGWQMPKTLPAGTKYGRGQGVFCGTAERAKKAPSYTGMIEVPPQFVVERDVHAGWIDWNESNAPLCAPGKS